MNESDDTQGNGFETAAAVVCEHVARQAPILHAVKSEPEDAADSGWQFLCGADDETWENAQVWAIHEVLSSESTLAPYLAMPTGTELRRLAPGVPWTPAAPRLS